MKHMKMIKLMMIALLVGGCSTADLRSASLKESGYTDADMERGRRILQLATWRQDKALNWDRYDEWQVVAYDIWEDGLIRRLTPLTEWNQRLSFDFRIREDYARMEFLNGRNAGEVVGIDQGQPYKLVDDQKVKVESSKIRLYLDPVRDYFVWPQALVNSDYIVYDEEMEIDGEFFHKIFVTNESWAPTEKNDQFIVWITKDNLRIKYIEFTLRDMVKSYRGVVEYDDYREVQNMKLPHLISLKSDVREDDYSHKFVVEEMQFNKDPNELTFSLEVNPANLERMFN